MDETLLDIRETCRQEYYVLLRFIKNKIDSINETTPYSDVDPKWFCNMMELEGKIIELQGRDE